MSKNKKIAVGFLMVLPVFFWVFIILRNSVNVPWFDDFDPFPDFLHKWISSPSFSDRLKLLFKPNNEHRMVIGKLVTLIYYWLTGHLNFTFLHIAGAGFTLGTLFLFWKSFKTSKLNWWYFLPVPFLLFQLQYHLIFLWAICSLQHQPVVFFVILSMFLLARNRFGWAVLAAFCATYAMSNGIFVWVSGAAILVLRSNYRLFIFWCSAGALAIGFYFMGLSAQGNESSIAFFIKNPHLSVLGFFAFLGGLFDLFPEKTIVTRSVLPVIMGFLVMIWIATWLLNLLLPWLRRTLNWPIKLPAFVSRFSAAEKDGKPLQEFLLGILIFLLVNALVIGLLRPRFGFFVMIVSNYKMYPALFLIIAYLSFISSMNQVNFQKRGFQVAMIVSVLIWGISIYSYLPTITERRKYLLINAYNQEHNGFGLGHIPFSSSAEYVDTLMKGMVSSGVYIYPNDTDELVSKIKKINRPIVSDSTISMILKDNKIFIDDLTIPVDFDRTSGQYAFVKNQSKVYLFKSNQNKYSGRSLFKQYVRGSSTEIPLSYLSPGTYKLGIVRVSGVRTRWKILKSINVP